MNEYTARRVVTWFSRSRLCRAVAVRVASGDIEQTSRPAPSSSERCSAAKHELGLAEKLPAIGIATTLNWTPSGGELMLGEAPRCPARARCTCGKMATSEGVGRRRFSYIRSRASIVRLRETPHPIERESTCRRAQCRRTAPRWASRSSWRDLDAARRERATDVALSGEITCAVRCWRVEGLKQKCLRAIAPGSRTRPAAPERAGHGGDPCSIRADCVCTSSHAWTRCWRSRSPSRSLNEPKRVEPRLMLEVARTRTTGVTLRRVETERAVTAQLRAVCSGHHARDRSARVARDVRGARCWDPWARERDVIGVPCRDGGVRFGQDRPAAARRGGARALTAFEQTLTLRRRAAARPAARARARRAAHSQLPPLEGLAFMLLGRASASCLRV